MDRPGSLFDRETEWDALSSFVSDDAPGVQLALVRGRRRQGKSFLLRRLADAAGGFYFQALQHERQQALAEFARAVGQHLGVPGGQLAFDDWERAFDSIAAFGADRPVVVIIDEFPYLLDHSPELPSLVQRFIDERESDGPPIRLILCGSALSVMAHLLEGSQALRGRAVVDLVMRPFAYRTSAEFWGVTDPIAALNVHAVVGGTPGYRSLMRSAAPVHVDGLFEWLWAGPLQPASALFREDVYLLTEERSLTDRQLYHSVLAAIADGSSTQGAIAQALGRDINQIRHPVRSLVDVGFVLADDDVLRSRRPIYRLADPIVRFHHAITRRDLARFEDLNTEAAWADAQQRFATHVLGPDFEDIARTFARRFASVETMGGRPSTVGPAIVNDRVGRTQHQLDLVALARTDTGAERVIAIGEAKHTAAVRTLADIDRLEHVRSLIAAKRPEAANAKLLLMSANGFDDHLVEVASGRSDVELIDAERLYVGS